MSWQSVGHGIAGLGVLALVAGCGSPQPSTLEFDEVFLGSGGDLSVQRHKWSFDEPAVQSVILDGRSGWFVSEVTNSGSRAVQVELQKSMTANGYPIRQVTFSPAWGPDEPEGYLRWRKTMSESTAGTRIVTLGAGQSALARVELQYPLCVGYVKGSSLRLDTVLLGGQDVALPMPIVLKPRGTMNTAGEFSKRESCPDHQVWGMDEEIPAFPPLAPDAPGYE